MTGYLGKVTNGAEDSVDKMAQDQRETQWGPIPGEVVSYDAAKGTATVRPLYKPTVNGQSLTMPDLYEVPVDMPRTANGGMTFPVPAGSKVMLSPQMRATEAYEEGNDGAATDARSFHVSTMRASLAGGDPLSSPLENADGDNFHLRFNASGSFGLKGSPDGKFQLSGAQGDVFDILATALEKDAEGFTKLGTEATLDHMADYASIGADLTTLAAKIRGMVL